MFGHTKEKQMFMPYPIDYIELFIDSFQGIKITFTDQVIKDKILNKCCHDYVNSQTEFAKMLKNNYIKVSKHFVETQTEFWFPKTEVKDEQKNNNWRV